MATRTRIGHDKNATGPGIPEIQGQDTNSGTFGNSPAFPHPLNRETDAGPMHEGRALRAMPEVA